MQLTSRQAQILKAVVECHHATGKPVGSRTLVDEAGVVASPSTVRYELGRLEQLGLIEQPHTSAGRVPTDEGFRTYVDHLLEAPSAPAGLGAAHTGAMARHGAAGTAEHDPPGTAPAVRIDEALRATTQALAEATGLLSVVTAPRASGAVIRHVEVLQLQPALLMAVVITAAGDVARHVAATGAPVDPGLVDWAGEYLNEQVAGMSIGQNLLRQRLDHPDLPPAERAILALLAPAFSDLAAERPELHVGGSPTAIARLGGDVQRVVQLVAMLDERRRLLEALRPLGAGVALTRRSAVPRVSVRIGCENDMPELHRLSVVGAAYGPGPRPLGMVGLIGPRSMDYTRAMGAVHVVADGLSELADELYAD